MPNSLPLLPRPLRAARILALALTLLVPIAARADFAADVQEPLRLLKADQFGKALVALQKISPRYQDQVGLHYLLGVTRLGSLKKDAKALDLIRTFEMVRDDMLKAQPLARTDQQKKDIRDLLETAESGLRELGAVPEKVAPAAAKSTANSKEAEIEKLKRRLAELEAKPLPAQTSKARPNAAPASTATANRVVPSKYPATPRRAGYVAGRVLNSAGQPLVGAEISIYGTTARGDRAQFAALSGANGLFSQRVPDGIYGVGAQWKTSYNGKNYVFSLDPEDGKTGVAHDAASGVVKNFRWKIAGLKPGERAGEPNTHTEGRKYYGGYVSVSAQERGFGGDYIYFPQGSTLEMTLTPRAKLIDGSTGTPKTFHRRFKSNLTGIFSWYLENVPIGLYTLSAQLLGADGTSQALGVKRSLDSGGAFAPSVTVDFEPTQFGDMQMMQITVEPLYLPLK